MITLGDEKDMGFGESQRTSMQNDAAQGLMPWERCIDISRGMLDQQQLFFTHHCLGFSDASW